jgi:hypothetical protein
VPGNLKFLFKKKNARGEHSWVFGNLHQELIGAHVKLFWGSIKTLRVDSTPFLMNP